MQRLADHAQLAQQHVRVDDARRHHHLARLTKKRGAVIALPDDAPRSNTERTPLASLEHGRQDQRSR